MNGFGHVWAAVERFRGEHLAGQEHDLPVDVFSLVELRLRLDVIPFDDLAAKFGVHAQAILARFDREGLWPAP